MDEVKNMPPLDFTTRIQSIAGNGSSDSESLFFPYGICEIMFSHQYNMDGSDFILLPIFTLP